MITIMLDLETWGTDPGNDLRSIGACVFKPLTGWVASGEMPEWTNDTFYIATENPGLPPETSGFCPDAEHIYYDATTDMFRKYPLIRNPQTVQWWNDQSEEARAAFSDPVDLREALIRFAIWIDNLERPTINHLIRPLPIRIYAHGPTMDVSMLAAAYRACGLPVPWHYRAPRDTRTCFDMAGIEDHSAFLQRFNTGAFHHALDDAISQARAVCEAVRMMRDDADDLTAAIKGRASIDAEGAIPGEVSLAIRTGRNPVAAWREYRTMSQAKLADAVGCTQAAIARIEGATGSAGRIETRRRIAEALDAPLWSISYGKVDVATNRIRDALTDLLALYRGEISGTSQIEGILREVNAVLTPRSD